MDSGLYRDYNTYREIIRQQKGWTKVLQYLEGEKTEFEAMIEAYKNRVWVFTGCGSSYYLAQTASSIFSSLTGIRSRALPASEILIFSDQIFSPADEYLFIPISRSGTTTEVVKAAQKVRNELKSPTLAVSCDSKSRLSLESDLLLTLPFEPEKSVVMTGSFTTMLIGITYMASLFSASPHIKDKIRTVAESSLKLMNESEDLVSKIAKVFTVEEFVFLGQGPYWGIANEAALKMQEMTLSVSQSFHSLEYRHGPISTANEKSLVTILLCQAARNYGMPLVRDLKQLNARVFVLGEITSDMNCNHVDFHLKNPSGFGDILSSFLYMPILQLLAYHRAIAKNINPDQPRNLTAVVKLEL